MSELTLPFLVPSTRDDAIRAYGADIGRLHRATEEADRFCRRVLDHYLADTPDPTVRAERTTELALTLPPLPRPDNVLSAELLARSDDPGRDLTDAVRFAAARLVAGVVLTLHTLAANRVSGRIDWPRPDLCRFTFYEETLTRTVTKTRKRKRKQGNPPPTSTPGRRVLHTDTVTEVETTTDHRRWTQSEHHLADATAVSPGYTRWAVPARVVALISSAPEWVRRHLLIVEGTRIVERSITWESSKSSDRILEQRDIPVYAPDPALTLGEFVLAGWTEPENQNSGQTVLPAHPAPPSDRSALSETAVLAGVVLTLLLAIDAGLRARSGDWWPIGVIAVLITITLGVLRVRSMLRRSAASGTIHPIPHSASRPGSDDTP